MRQRLLVALLLVVILTLPMLGCGGAESLDPSQGTTKVEAPIAERLADCLAEMFPQMSRDELERHAKMQMTEAGEIRNAEAFVEKFCGDGDAATQLAPTDIAIPTSDVPVSTNPSKPDAVLGLGVSRSEMEDFFLARIAEERGTRQLDHVSYPTSFASVGDTEGEGKVTKVEWTRGRYATLAGADEGIYSIVLGCSRCKRGEDYSVATRRSHQLRKGHPLGVEWEFATVTDLLPVVVTNWPRPQRYRWIQEYFDRRPCGGSSGRLAVAVGVSQTF